MRVRTSILVMLPTAGNATNSQPVSPVNVAVPAPPSPLDLADDATNIRGAAACSGVICCWGVVHEAVVRAESERRLEARACRGGRGVRLRGAIRGPVAQRRCAVAGV